MTLRKEFVQLALLDGSNVSQLCRRFGISRDCGYHWIKRYQNEGEAGLLDRSKAPLNSPGKTAQQIEALVAPIRVENPTWGGRKIFHYLRNEKL